MIEATGNLKLVDQTLDSGWVRAKIPGGASFGAREVRKFAGVGVEGQVSGTISSKELEAQGSANVSAGPVSATGDALVNTAGIAGCATATVGVVVHKTLSIGGAYRWNGQTSVFSDSCGFGHLKTALGARAAASGPVPVTVPVGTHQINLIVHGSAGPPTVDLTDAHGHTALIAPESDGSIGQAAYVAVEDTADGDTDIALAGLPAGTAEVAPAPGTPAIGPVGAALPLPKPNVKARLTLIGPRRYRLRWSSASHLPPTKPVALRLPHRRAHRTRPRRPSAPAHMSEPTH